MPGRKLSLKSRAERGYGIINMDEPWNYRPWIHAKDLYNGNGRRHVIPDLKYPERQIHLMSNLELDVYHMLRRNKLVQELFEQYPLDMEKTVSICEILNIVNPKNPRNGEKIVMTTDFLAVVTKGGQTAYRAYAVKSVEEIKDIRVQEKLKIEQE